MEHVKVEIEGFPQFAQTVAELRDELRQIRILIEKDLELPGSMKLNWGSPSDQIPIDEILEFRNQFQKENHMPGKETDTQTVPCSEVETDAAGNPVVLNPANVKWAIDDPTIATLTQNSDGSATFKAVKPVAPAVNPRTANVTCTDTVTNVVGADTLEVDDSPTQPGKMTLVFGTPA
jgi:hypothetical protein